SHPKFYVAALGDPDDLHDLRRAAYSVHHYEVQPIRNLRPVTRGAVPGNVVIAGREFAVPQSSHFASRNIQHAHAHVGATVGNLERDTRAASERIGRHAEEAVYAPAIRQPHHERIAELLDP